MAIIDRRAADFRGADRQGDVGGAKLPERRAASQRSDALLSAKIVTN